MKGLYIFFKYEFRIIRNIRKEISDIVASLYSFVEEEKDDDKEFYDLYRRYKEIIESNMSTLSICGFIMWSELQQEAEGHITRIIVKKCDLEMEKIINGDIKGLP